MNNKTITYFQAIERTRSISAAADELGISQPALSAHLKKAEKKLGAVLFDRSRSPLVLTDAGRVYLDYAKNAQALEHELMQKVSDVNDLKSGRLIIGGASSFNYSYLPRTLALFAERFPGIEIEVINGTVPDLSAAAFEGSIDLFITPRANETDRFEYEELVTERVFLCVPRNWPLANELPAATADGYAMLDDAGFKAISSSTFVMLHENQQVGSRLRSLLARHGVTPSRTVIVDQTLTALALTQAGIGISFVTEGALRCAGEGSKPALYLADEDLCTRMLYLARPKNRTLSRAAHEFAVLMGERAQARR